MVIRHAFILAPQNSRTASRAKTLHFMANPLPWRGGVIQDRGYIVEIKENAFNLPGVVAIVSEVATILASLAADLNLAAMAGPY